MPNHPVLVRQITHLTDARYFAAMGVDWMSLELTRDPQSFAFWHAVRDWVAGVKLAAEFDAADEDLVAKVFIDALPDGLVIAKDQGKMIETDLPCFYIAESIAPDTLPKERMWIVSYLRSDAGRFIKPTSPPQNLFLAADWDVDALQELLTAGYEGGICLQGSEEEEKGLKDYSTMDELFILLRP